MTAPAGGPTPRRLLLGIDSATEYLALSLVEAHGGPAAGETAADSPTSAGATALLGGAEVARRVTQLGREHAARIMGELEALFSDAGAKRSDVVGVGVGVGPGSYTGVRIGVATAVALGRAWGVPVGGSSSLLALLGADLAPGAAGVALLDARKGNVYALAGRRLAGAHASFEAIGEPVKVPLTEVAARFPGLPRYEGPTEAAVLARRALLTGSLEPWYL